MGVYRVSDLIHLEDAPIHAPAALTSVCVVLKRSAPLRLVVRSSDSAIVGSRSHRPARNHWISLITGVLSVECLTPLHRRDASCWPRAVNIDPGEVTSVNCPFGPERTSDVDRSLAIRYSGYEPLVSLFVVIISHNTISKFPPTPPSMLQWSACTTSPQCCQFPPDRCAKMVADWQDVF
jgi:hypothetical protein